MFMDISEKEFSKYGKDFTREVRCYLITFELLGSWKQIDLLSQ